MSPLRFAHRCDAGQQLGKALLEYAGQRPAVLAVPRGGVVVGREVARMLGGDLAALAVKKVACPFNPELAVGAVAPDGTQVINTDAVRALGITAVELQAAVDEAVAEARRRESLYAALGLPSLAGRLALIVDDGLATGYTAIAAARYVRRCGPSLLVVAVPVAARTSAHLVKRECDRFVALFCPQDMEAVGQYYDDFSPTTDEEVLAILASFRAGEPPSGTPEAPGGAPGNEPPAP